MAIQIHLPVIFNFSISYRGLNDTRVQISLSASQWQLILCLVGTILWILLSSDCLDKNTFTSVGQAQDLFLFSKMASLFLALSYLHFYKRSYRQQEFLECFQVVVLQLELQELQLREASNSISISFIKTLGRWSNEALLYVHTPVSTILSVAARLS